jgi:hypothetical protein
MSASDVIYIRSVSICCACLELASMPVREPYRFGIQEIDEVNQTALKCYQAWMPLAIPCESIYILGQGHKPLGERRVGVGLDAKLGITDAGELSINWSVDHNLSESTLISSEDAEERVREPVRV